MYLSECWLPGKYFPVSWTHWANHNLKILQTQNDSADFELEFQFQFQHWTAQEWNQIPPHQWFQQVWPHQHQRLQPRKKCGIYFWGIFKFKIWALHRVRVSLLLYAIQLGSYWYVLGVGQGRFTSIRRGTLGGGGLGELL